MSQTRKLPRPSGLPVRTGLSRHSMTMVPPSVGPPLATRRGSLVRPNKSALRLASMARDVKSVQDIAALAGETTCIRKTASYSCLKQPTAEDKRKVQIVESAPMRDANFSASTNVTENKTPSIILLADCQRVLQSLHSKAVRNSSEFDDSVASLLSENMDLLDVRFDISVASGSSEVVDRTPSVEDLPMECEATTPGQVISLSLDTGYQGDGELSRPESRNAESEVRLIKANDDFKAMTDSDFFTESDADCHDESGLNRRRDRKAQVIDGTLYGGPSERSQAEDMESSGIYSDLERKPDPPSYQELISQQIKTIEDIVSCQKEKEPVTPESTMVKSSSGDSSTTILETPTVKVSPAGSVKKEIALKNKMPNRNVESKLKALLASESTRAEVKPRTPKRGKWDAVMDKIAAGRDKQPLPSKFRQVKSKVYQAVNGPRGGSGCPSPTSEKYRSRRSTRVRSSESSLVSPKSKQARSSVNSTNSTPHSSISDLSVSSSLHRSGKKREGVSNGREHNISSSLRDIKRSREANGPVSKSVPPINNANIKTPTPRRPNTFRSINSSTQQSYPLKDVNQNGVVSKSISTNSITSTSPNIIINTNSSKTKTVVRAPKNPTISARNGIIRASRDPVPILKRNLADSNKAVEALAALLNYCTHDLDAFNTPSLKKDLNVAQCKLILTEEEVNSFKASCLRLEEELKTTQNLLNEARSDGANLHLSLDAEQKRFLVVHKELESSRASCLQLEHLLQEAQIQLNLLHSQEAGYHAQINSLTEVSEKFEQVLSLKHEADQSLRESQIEKSSLELALKDSECEIKMLTADNIKLREKISRLSVENIALKNDKSESANNKELDRAKPLDVKWGESRNDRSSFCLDQRIIAGVERLSGGDNSECSLLSEVDSLRQVLALKTEEVSELHRQELHLKVEADRVPKLLSLVTTLEAKVEDLQSQLSSQNEVVRNLNKEKGTLQDELKTESAQKTRLSLKNEELQYKLRVNSEAVRELVRMNLIDERTVECPSIASSPRRLDDSRPQMVGVVQKSDSVSYMLDMGEDTAEIVSNIVRGAETARSQTLPKKKRTRTLESVDTSTTEYYSCVDSSSMSPATTPRRPARSRACVRLLHSDFATDSIELPREADCEVIEITGSFDRPEPEMSCSTSSNSSSNFDIESEVYAESPVMTQYPQHKRLDPEGQDVTPEPDELNIEMPRLDDTTFHPLPPLTLPAAGEAMVSSDEE